MRTRERLLAAVALALIPAFPGLARSQYTFKTIDVPGAYRTAINGIGPSALVGEFQSRNEGPTEGFLVKDGAFTTIDVPTAVQTAVYGINAGSQICGSFCGPDGIHHGFLRGASGLFTIIDPRGSIDTYANGVDLHGNVVGTFQDTARTRHGFLWSKGQFTVIDDPSASGLLIGGGTVALGMNDSGKVVGNFTTFQSAWTLDRHGFIKDRLIYTKIDVPNSTSTVIAGINNDGTIAGSFYDRRGRHGYVMINKVFTTIDIGGPDSQTAVLAIDGIGRIAGSFTDAAGATHGFLGTPIGK